MVLIENNFSVEILWIHDYAETGDWTSIEEATGTSFTEEEILC